MGTLKRLYIALTGIIGLSSVQSPGARASASFAGRSVNIKYSSPSVRGRQIFGNGGLLSRDSSYPVWRAGADAATTLRTDVDLDIAGLHVPAGTYTLYVLVDGPEKWNLIVNNQTGQNGNLYDPGMDMGRVGMKVEKTSIPLESLKFRIDTRGDTGTLQLEWENYIASVAFRAIGTGSPANQCQNPTGWLGRLVLRNMNSRHSKVTDWGLSHISIGERDIVLDIGCGGGRTVDKLALMATHGKIYGIDHSKESVAVARRTNKRWIDVGRVDLRQASVSQLPFSGDMFDVVTAVETHFWWPALPADMREVLRVLKPGGTLILIAEVYKGAETFTAKAAAKYSSRTGMALLSIQEHRELFTNAGYSDVKIFAEPSKGWICGIGRKPPVQQVTTT